MKKTLKFLATVFMICGVFWVHTDDFERLHYTEAQIVASD